VPELAGQYDAAQNAFNLSVTGEIGRRYRLEASSALTGDDWQDFVVWTNLSTSTQFLDAAGLAKRFYRAVTP